MVAKIINLFAGPGAGKSTTASSLFALMKSEGIRCELVTEYAKDLTYEGALTRLSNQLLVTAEQDQRLRRLVDQVDYVITDSPLPQALLYASAPFDGSWFREAVLGAWSTYDNASFFIARAKPYETYGRSQTEEQAKEIDTKVRRLLHNEAIPHKTVTGNTHAASRIFVELIKEH